MNREELRQAFRGKSVHLDDCLASLAAQVHGLVVLAAPVGSETPVRPDNGFAGTLALDLEPECPSMSRPREPTSAVNQPDLYTAAGACNGWA